VVDQLNGVSAVRHAHLVGLHEEARRLAGLFERFRISWVLGELSAEADRLVKRVGIADPRPRCSG
jgi:hypothetical protein